MENKKMNKMDKMNKIKTKKKITMTMTKEKNEEKSKRKKTTLILDKSNSRINYNLYDELLIIHNDNIKKFKLFKELDYYEKQKTVIYNILNKIKNNILCYSNNVENALFMDELILNFIKKNYSNLLMLILHSSFSKNNIDVLDSKYKKNIIVKKKIILSHKAYICLKNNISSFETNRTFKSLVTQSINQGYKLNTKNTLYVYVLTNINKDDIKGNFNNPHNRTLLCDKELLEISMVLFNYNSILFLENQLTERYIKLFNKSIYKRLILFKKFLYKHIEEEYYDKFIITGGTLLSIYGLRKSNDLDLIISNYPKKTNTKLNKEKLLTFNKEINDNFISNTRKNKHWDAIYPSLKWKTIYKKFHKEWANSVGANNILQCIHDPRYHFYYLGVKFIILDLEIYRRKIRNRPASISDLIGINYYLKKKIIIPPIKKKYKYIFDNDVKEIIVDKLEFIKTVNFHLRNKYNITISISKLSKLITFEN
jgi:hypothetical protein